MKAKIRILIRRIKRSYKKDREQWIKGGILTVILLVIVPSHPVLHKEM